MKIKARFWCGILLVLGLGACPIQGQRGNILYGDLIVEEDSDSGLLPLNYHVILYTISGYILARQTVAPNGRYRFTNLADGEYDIAIEVENNEITRVRIQLRSPVHNTDFRQDITLGWKTLNKRTTRPVSVTADDFYKRSVLNQRIFNKAQDFTDNKKYAKAVELLQQLVKTDPNDFQAWTELGTVFLIEKNLSSAEKAYDKSVAIRPKFFLALMNLGKVRLMQNNFEGAVAAFTRAIQVRADSAAANYYLGEAYLQMKRGSQAVGYFYEALRLDPLGKAEAHLRLAALYNGAGLKQKAAIEYAQFLKKKPDYPDKKKLEDYISHNKKP